MNAKGNTCPAGPPRCSRRETLQFAQRGSVNTAWGSWRLEAGAVHSPRHTPGGEAPSAGWAAAPRSEMIPSGSAKGIATSATCSPES